MAGVAEGCVQAGCALVGGETAEMPGFYPEDEYDLAGFSVGAVDKDRILDKTAMREGDAVVALPSSGVHSNGFSLVRKVFDVEKAARLPRPPQSWAAERWGNAFDPHAHLREARAFAA